MSKLVDKLAKLSRNTGPSIGFRVSQAAQSRGMLLVAEVPGSKISLAKGAVAAGVDALVVRIDSLSREAGALEEAAKRAGDVAWGVHINKLGPDDAATLRGAGADFVIVSAPTAPAAVLSEKDLGKAIQVDSGWADSMIRVVDQVALDAILLEVDGGDTLGLSLHSLLQCQRVSMLARKPLLVGLPTGADSAALTALHSIGVEGVVYKYTDEASAGPLEKLKKAIDALPAYRGRGKGIALLPKVEAASPAEKEEEEEDDDDN